MRHPIAVQAEPSAGHRLAVLDKYAHVLQEYDDRELRELVEGPSMAQVALANTMLSDGTTAPPRMLRGMSSDCAAEWITRGSPGPTAWEADHAR
eukprot:Skav217741  [mRNA]  locus=scaffold2847:147114:149326:+ [translate_table: standard]